MSFVMFATWVFVGALAGVLASLILKRGGHGLKVDIVLGLAGGLVGSWVFRGLVYAGTGMLGGVVIAFLGAAAVLVAQRQFRPSQRAADAKGAIWTWGLGAALVAATVWMNLAPSPPAATAATTEDRSYAVTPASLSVKAGIVTGELAEMKVTEQVEVGSDRVVTQAKLRGMLRLKNTSANETVRLVSARLRYIDAEGQPIKLEDMRSEPAVTLRSSTNDRLDPGQEASESVDVDFPAEALKDKRLKEIRLELAYIPSVYREQALNFPVSIGSSKPR
jgi:uncharacterized membrane protein YeaQ/YmgE (transglycosylase-associated protein family)